MNARSGLAAGAFVIVAAGLGFGFTQTGSPDTVRAKTADARLQEAIEMRAIDGEDLVDRKLYGESTSASTKTIRYVALPRHRYALCATFALEGNAFDEDSDPEPAWKHSAGLYCYRFDARSASSDVPLSGSAGIPRS